MQIEIRTNNRIPKLIQPPENIMDSLEIIPVCAGDNVKLYFYSLP